MEESEARSFSGWGPRLEPQTRQLETGGADGKIEGREVFREYLSTFTPFVLAEDLIHFSLYTTCQIAAGSIPFASIQGLEILPKHRLYLGPRSFAALVAEFSQMKLGLSPATVF